MTRKAVRAQNIRRLTDADRSRLDTDSGWVKPKPDAERERYLAAACNRLTHEETETILARAKELVGLYRARGGSSATSEMTPSREVELGAEVIELVDELRERLACLPDRVRASAEAALFGARRRWLDETVSALDRDLAVVGDAIRAGVDEVRSIPVVRGRKPNTLRNELVCELFAETRRCRPDMSRDSAADLVHAILTAYDVDIPDVVELLRIASRQRIDAS